jgi:hypothetical protein
VKLVYDPANRRVSGFVNEQRFADFTNASPANIQFVGWEANTGDPTFFAHANYFMPVLCLNQHLAHLAPGSRPHVFTVAQAQD